MFSLLSGRLVHVTRTLNEQLVAQASRPPPLLASVAPDVPAPVAAVVDRALAFEKARRWPDARTMRQAIHAAQRVLGEAPLPRGAAPPAIVVGPRPTTGGTVAPSVSDARRSGGGSTTVLLGVLAGAVCVLLGAAVVLHYTRGATLAPAPAPASPPSSAPASAAPSVAAAPSAEAAPSAAVSAAPEPPEPPPTAVPDRPSKASKPPPAPKKPPAPARPGGDSWLDRQH
jgi:serine/threonine-protein kinase